MSRILILGAGTAGTIMANRLRNLYADDIRGGWTTITIVDQNDAHVYRPGLLFIPFGKTTPDQLVRPRRQQVHPDVTYVYERIDRVDVSEHKVHFIYGPPIGYDVLIVATGTRLVPHETEGLTGRGWQESVFDFYTLDGATKLAQKLADWPGGHLVIDVAAMPIKCPVAPLEFAFLADSFFTSRGIRDRVEITYVTPLDAAFTESTCSEALGQVLAEKGINLVTDFSAGRVDGRHGALYSIDEREIPFDLLVTVPLHRGAEFVSRSPGLGDDRGFVITDPYTLQTKIASNVFAIGDATNVPASKAGSVAHFQAEVLTENVRRYLAIEPLKPNFDGHANCFIETGFAIRWMYWNALLRGHSIPGVGPRMSMWGKRVAYPSPDRGISPTVARAGM